MGSMQDNKPPKTPTDFPTYWEVETPMQAIRAAENELRQGRYKNVVVILHNPDDDGGTTFLRLKNDMSFDAQAACALWFTDSVMRGEGSSDE